MKSFKLIVILLISIILASCNQVKLNDGDAAKLINKTLQLPQKCTQNIGFGLGCAILLEGLKNDGLIFYKIRPNGFEEPILDLTPTEKGQPYYLGKKGENYVFKANDVELDQITGIAVNKETQTATIRFTVRATNITPIAKSLSRVGYNEYPLEMSFKGELVFKKFDNGWQLESNKNKSSIEILDKILQGHV